MTVILVEQEVPLVVSCAKCGWTPDLWTPDPGLLLHAVVDHWLAKHWTGTEEDAPGQERP